MKKSSLTSYAHSSWTNLQSDGFYPRNVNVVIGTIHPVKLLGSCLSDQWFEHLDNSNRKGDGLLNERTEGAWKDARVGPRFRHQNNQVREGPCDILKVIYILHMLSLVASLFLPIVNTQHSESCMLLTVYMKNVSPFKKAIITHSKDCLL